MKQLFQFCTGMHGKRNIGRMYSKMTTMIICFFIVRLWVIKNQNKFYFSQEKKEEGIQVCFLVLLKKYCKYNIQIKRGFVNFRR